MTDGPSSQQNYLNSLTIPNSNSQGILQSHRTVLPQMAFSEDSYEQGPTNSESDRENDVNSNTSEGDVDNEVIATGLLSCIVPIHHVQCDTTT